MVRIDFLNVGHGDCTVIQHASQLLTMIDINNGQEMDIDTLNELQEYYPLGLPQGEEILNESLLLEKVAAQGYNIDLTNPIDFLREQYPGKDIFRYIQSHPHKDHMCGLAALYADGRKIHNFWDTAHSFVPPLKDENNADLAEYQAHQKGLRGNKILRLNRGASGIYYGENPAGVKPGDGIEILHPPFGRNTSATGAAAENPNNFSYILRLTYNGIKIIFGGDAEEAAWEEVAEYYGADLKCDILKASHHGRDTGYCAKAVALMQPEYTIVSVGKKPETDASSKYSNYCKNVWSTRWRGNIWVTIDDAGCGKIKSQYTR